MSKQAGYNKGKSNSNVSTPWDFIKQCEARWGPLSLDLAASKENSKAGAYITEEEDSLKVDWFEALQTRCLSDNFFPFSWLNPPFSHIRPWAQKCAEYADRMNILFLVPASVATKWHEKYVHNKAHVYWINRITFVGQEHPYPKDLQLAHYGPHVSPGYSYWRV